MKRRTQSDEAEHLPTSAIAWSRLGLIGNSPITKLTIAVPILGWLIIFNHEVDDWLALSHRLFGDQSVPVPVHIRLYLSYFGLCITGVAAAIYVRFCPPEIKRFETPEQYIEAIQPIMDGSTRLRVTITRQIEEDAATLKALQPALRRAEYDRQSASTPEASRRASYRESADLLDAHYRMLDLTYPNFRRAVAVGFAAGIFASAIPPAEMFCRVSGVLFGDLIALFY